MKRAFSQEQCDTLFAHVLVDDVVDDEISLPDVIRIEYSSDQISDFFHLCQQTWQYGLNFDRLKKTNTKFFKRQDLPINEFMDFKYIRARFKLFRFAFQSFDSRHEIPYLINRFTISMGKLQDHFKNKKGSSFNIHAVMFRMFLTGVMENRILSESGSFKGCSEEQFRKYLYGQIDELDSYLELKQINAKTFHNIRKISSCHVAIYDTIRTLYPSAYHHRIARYLAAINGTMGEMHDRMIEAAAIDPQSYHRDLFDFPPQVREWLTNYSARHKGGNPQGR